MTYRVITRPNAYHILVANISNRIYLEPTDLLSNGKVLIDLTVSDARALSQALKELADKIEKEKK